MRRLDALLARKPSDARALLLKAQFMLRMGNIDQALAFARTAVAANPNSGDAKLAFGRALAAKGDREGAFEQLIEAVRLDPSSTQAAKELARLALTLGRDQIALQYARQVVRQDPADQEAALVEVTALVRLRDYSIGLTDPQAPALPPSSLTGAARAARDNPGSEWQPGRQGDLRACPRVETRLSRRVEGSLFRLISPTVARVPRGRVSSERSKSTRTNLSIF